MVMAALPVIVAISHARKITDIEGMILLRLGFMTDV
jgi:hypothetical protein